MKLLIWTAQIIAGAVISYNLFDMTATFACVVTFGLMIIILPTAGQPDRGDSDGK